MGRVASNKTQLPILGNILLKTDKNRLLIAATNLEIASTQYIRAKITKEGSITVPSKLIVEFLSNLPKDNVELEVKDNNLHIKSGNYKSIINGFIADDFPELPVIDEVNSVHYIINVSDFKKAISQTIITSSHDNTRPVLTGVLWYSYEGYLYLASTDGYRLSEKKLLKTKSIIKSIIPTTTLQEVMRNITENITEIDIIFNEKQVAFRVGESEITSRLIEGNYPDYRQLIPTSSDIEVTIANQDFSRITKISGLFARDSGGSITITADKENQILSIHSIASQTGENTSSSTAEVSEDGKVTLNSRYLSEALSVLDSDMVSFKFSGKLSPCIISSNNTDSDYKHIIMPLKS